MPNLSRRRLIASSALAPFALAPTLRDGALLALAGERRRASDRLDQVLAAEGAYPIEAWDEDVGRLTAALENLDALIAATPAETVAGLLVKLRTAAKDLPPVPWDTETVADHALRTALADAERIARHNQGDS